MAHCALFLASRTSSYVTGAILVADGGSWLTSANDVSMLLGIASSKSAKLWTGALKCPPPDPVCWRRHSIRSMDKTVCKAFAYLRLLICIKALVSFSLSGYWSSEKKRDKWILKRRTNCCSITFCCCKLYYFVWNIPFRIMLKTCWTIQIEQKSMCFFLFQMHTHIFFWHVQKTKELFTPITAVYYCK